MRKSLIVPCCLFASAAAFVATALTGGSVRTSVLACLGTLVLGLAAARMLAFIAARRAGQTPQKGAP